MYRIAMLFSLILLSINLFVYAAVPPTNSIAPMLKNVMPTVVNVRVDNELPASIELQQQQHVKPTQTQLGSGVIIDASKGYILTNAHLVKDAKSIAITLNDHRHYIAKLIGFDLDYDIAVLQIKAEGLHAILLGNANNLQIGDFVAAIGSPFGLNQTATFGIISALKRNDLNIQNYENFIQTDAAINMGNSGGALVTYDGKLIGINTAIIATTRSSPGNIGIGFAIPINTAYSIMQQLIKYGKTQRGSLGIFSQLLTPNLAVALNLPAKQQGVVITAVTPGSPAKSAGLQVGDLILRINNEKVKTPFDVRNAIGLLRVGSKVSISLLRNGKKLITHAFIVNNESQMQQLKQQQPFLSGTSLSNVNHIQSVAHGMINGGVQVLSVDPKSPAGIAGLLPDDIIVAANQQPVNNIADLHKEEKQNKLCLLLNVIRGAGALLIVIK